MQIPPNADMLNIPLSAKDAGPVGYKWNANYPGTLKPGLVEDNYPLQRVLDSDVYENMVYDEFDWDERVADIFEPDEDLLEWLDKKGRLIPRNANNDDFDMEVINGELGTTMTEDDLDGYADDDSKMIAYYSKQSEGSAVGSSPDFGGFSESSSSDYGAGF